MNAPEKRKTFIELQGEMDRLFEEAEANGSEVDDAAMSAVDGEVVTKMDAVGYACKVAIPADIEKLKTVIELCRAKIAALEKRRERMLAYAGSFVELMQGIHKGTFTIYRRKTESVEVGISAQELPPEFRICTTEYTPNKKAIKDAIKSGADVPGARLVERETWCVK